MSKRLLPALCCLLLAAAAWLSVGQEAKPAPWVEVAPGVLRSPALPYGYALVADGRALLIDAPHAPADVNGAKVDMVLLTHHHWDSCAAVGKFLADRVPVRAPALSADWLTTAAVRKHWQESIPLRHSKAAYLVPPVGFDGIDCSLQDLQAITWRGWKVQVIATPGHARDHVAYAARQGRDGKLTLFAGDALAAPGKLWTPYTTDWNHWTDEGLTPTAASLRKLAALPLAVVLPAHGPALTENVGPALTRTADAVAEVAFLKSFERYSKQRLGNAPEYAFLAKAQVATGGKEPWTQVSRNLFLTGNTYVLRSQDNAFLVIDPYAKLSADQIARLRTDEKLGALEVVVVTHAHFDHYDGIYHLPEREKFAVWTLDRVAAPLLEPFRWRAPFLDARPIRVDRQIKDGETVAWREYRLRCTHFPGQSDFTMGIQTTIDGKRCFFTADNFFHQDQFSGSGGWMGLNRSFPLPYAASAEQVLQAAPDWVLAEHGGPFEFNAEDFQRRVRWGRASAAAADAISPSGSHRHDWDPHRVRFEPLVQKARPGAEVQGAVVVTNALGQPTPLAVTLLGRGLFPDQVVECAAPAQGTVRKPVSLRLGKDVAPGRHVFNLRVQEAGAIQGPDAFLIVDVE